MRFLAFLIFLFFSTFFFAGRWYFTCVVRNNCTGFVQKVRPAQRPSSLTVKMGQKNLMLGFDEFLFNRGSDIPNLNENNALFIDSLANFLKNQENAQLVVTGNYLSSEANISKKFYENIGLSRANAVRDLLIEKGAPKENIALDYNIPVKSATLENPLLFDIYLINDKEAANKPFLSYNFEDITFSTIQFGTDNASFETNSALLYYFDRLKERLELNKDLKLTIIAHTDGIGGEGENLEKGQKRADSIKSYFQEKMGIDKNRIISESKGETQPIAPNNNNWNRAKNRRINFVLQ